MKLFNIAVVALVNRDGQILLHLRKGEDETDLPGHWLLVGGAIEPGEEPHDTILREVIEELSYSLYEPQYLIAQNFEVNGCAKGVRHVFYELHDGVTEVRSREGFDLRWVHPNEFVDILTTKDVREVVEILKKKELI